jgi:hypothetical protein
MIGKLSAAVLACGLGFGILGCQDQNSGNPNNNGDNTYPSSSGNMSGSNGSGSVGSTGTYDSNTGRYNNGTGTTDNSTWNNRTGTPSGNTHGGMNSGSGYDRGSNNREQTGGFMNNTGSMSKEQPSTQP